MLHNVVEVRRILSAPIVTSAKAGVQETQETLDSGFRRNDGRSVQLRG
jgi:hypothetical protein